VRVAVFFAASAAVRFGVRVAGLGVLQCVLQSVLQRVLQRMLLAWQ